MAYLSIHRAGWSAGRGLYHASTVVLQLSRQLVTALDGKGRYY